jgi:hypothetical protein
MGQLVLEAFSYEGVLGRDQDVRRDVDPVVVAALQVVDEQPPGAQVPAADLQHPVLRLQPVPHQVVELHAPELRPPLA